MPQPQSEFAKAYESGLHKTRYWEPVYEDSMNLIARLPAIAALIYRNMYKGGKQIGAAPGLDWAGNLAHMMGRSTHAVYLNCADIPWSLGAE